MKAVGVGAAVLELAGHGAHERLVDGLVDPVVDKAGYAAHAGLRATDACLAPLCCASCVASTALTAPTASTALTASPRGRRPGEQVGQGLGVQRVVETALGELAAALPDQGGAGRVVEQLDHGATKGDRLAGRAHAGRRRRR